MLVRTTSTKRVVSRPLSFAFSGAGFLTSYHLGVVECLLKHELVVGGGSKTNRKSVYDSNNNNNNKYPSDLSVILSGVSGGALAITAIALSILPEDAMNSTMKIASDAKRHGGILDHLHPRFSLVDRVEYELRELTKDTDEEYVLRRINNGQLRIGLTDSGYFPFFRNNQEQAYMYVNQFESINEVIAACVLSSYVPGLTGPSSPARYELHPAVSRSTKIIHNMLQRGSIKDKHGSTRHNLYKSTSQFWDGGLANLFPIIDQETILVTPFIGQYNHTTISPPKDIAETTLMPTKSIARKRRQLLISKDAYIDLSLPNLRAMRYVALSSSDEELQTWFQQGYDTTLKFLDDHNLKTQHTVSLSTLDSRQRDTADTDPQSLPTDRDGRPESVAI